MRIPVGDIVHIPAGIPHSFLACGQAHHLRSAEIPGERALIRPEYDLTSASAHGR
jgi:hypothetical protein